MQLTRPQKSILMFLPIVILLSVFVAYICDIKSPHSEKTNCKVLAAGLNANKHRTANNVLYTSSGQKIHDISFNCQKLGVVVINDFDMFVANLKPGNPVQLIHKTYHWLPERWLVTISAIQK